MFKKTKGKIVFAIMGALVALLALTLAAISIANAVTHRQESMEMLSTYAARYTLEQDPMDPATPMEIPGGFDPGQDGGVRPDGERRGDLDPGRNEAPFRLSTFYSVALKDGEVLAVRNGNEALYSTETITSTARTLLEKSGKSGRYEGFYYLISEREDYTLVAMIDRTMNDRNESMLLREMLIFGGIAAALLLVISFFVAKAIVRPLEENDARQKRFISDAGHELKTPIAVISANSELLRREIGKSEWLDNIDYENGRMSDLVKQLLALSRAENGSLAMEDVDLSALVGGEALPFESLAFEAGRTIETEIEDGLRVEGNPNGLRELVSILLDNALSHGTGGAIDLSLKKEHRFAVLTVTNEAAPISPEKQAHLFDRFYRLDEARTEGGDHYGLGLSIAKAVAEAHGGEIRAEFPEGQVRMIVRLPVEGPKAVSKKI